MTMVYQSIAAAVLSREYCQDRTNVAWATRWSLRLDWLCSNHMPSGSGIDKGTGIDLDKSTPDRLVLTTAFHHMDDNGCYDGWTEHQIIVTPSLAFGMHLRVTGRNRRDIKDYLADIYRTALSAPVPEYASSFAELSPISHIVS